VTGTPVGCACGEGVIDWPRVIDIARRHGFQGVISVECGTVDQAERSLKYLQGVIGQPPATSRRKIWPQPVGLGAGNPPGQPLP